MYAHIGEKINEFDNYSLVLIQKYLQNKYLDIIMRIMSFIGNLGIVWIIIAIPLILGKLYRVIGISIFLTLIISTILGEGIVKHIVRRVRPCNKQDNFSLLISKPTSYSFPSGHTLSSFSVAEMLSMYFTQYKFIFMSVALLIALSRLYLCVHYPTDVIAGSIIGVLCSKIIFIILQEGYIEKLVPFKIFS
ncbi:phosphatase PAP2 family protein [Clostridium sp. FP1]|uniref:phosphatase PAP2 family protein n=1 Tax=Clostridium sp. FP1 TaxID=2724076 RepID=UPI0013E94E65|nr:phosphatase PAP2 family protein [Clostridium sp. FP1]MBZ9637621.1 phosphatase PAP2 family protein [Clostridium sp. FP1]